MAGPKHLAPRARRTTRQRLLIIAGATLSMVLFLGGTAFGYLYYQYSRIERYDVSIDLAEEGVPRNYLIVGSDSRDTLSEDDPLFDGFVSDAEPTSGQRTDTIMILRIDPQKTAAQIVSLPRDLWVPIAGTGEKNRINIAFSRGRDVLISTIKENFGIPIHHYVEIDFEGFQRLVGAIGGVDFYFDTRVRDKNSGLSVDTPGCVQLDGSQALAFARARHLDVYDEERGRWRRDETSDLGRISRQQALIRKAISKAVAKGLTNPLTLQDLVSTGVSNVGLDPTLDASDLVKLGRRFASFDAETLQTFALPVDNFRTSGGADVVRLIEEESEPVLNVFRGRPPGEVTPGLVEVTVLNGTGVAGQAGDVTEALGAVGFQTAEPGDTVERQARTAIYYAPGSEPAAQRLARHITGRVTFGVDRDLGTNDVVLVTGADFTTVHEQPSPTVPSIPTTTTTTAAGGATTTSTTTTTAVGYVPDDAPPPGVAC